MITSGKKAMLPSERSKVWKVVTSVEHYTWRSDLRGTEILCEKIKLQDCFLRELGKDEEARILS